MSVSECITIYEKVMHEVCGQERGTTPHTRFSSKNLRKALDIRVRKLLGLELDEIYLRDPDTCDGKEYPRYVPHKPQKFSPLTVPSFVIAIDREHLGEPDDAVLLRTYETKNPPTFEESCALWEASLATFATPVFLPQAHIQGKTILDGGLGHNNPAEYFI